MQLSFSDISVASLSQPKTDVSNLLKTSMRVAMLTVWRYLTRCRVATFAMACSKDLFEAYLSKHGYLSLSLQNGKILFRLWKPNGVKERADHLVFFCSGKLTVSKKEKTFCLRFSSALDT
ncbi:hypothetical protein TNCT_576171 [Trichonephila clavata]|uniref:Uncharacterized protein n=1 Tax=Trichonephila clavata TaxID=2740835 RepID=A0A8X6H5S7_TRICU|nr:hypothetical protein TNCT_576171 [Trichonephila clavata]